MQAVLFLILCCTRPRSLFSWMKKHGSHISLAGDRVKPRSKPPQGRQMLRQPRASRLTGNLQALQSALSNSLGQAPVFCPPLMHDDLNGFLAYVDRHARLISMRSALVDLPALLQKQVAWVRVNATLGKSGEDSSPECHTLTSSYAD